MNIYTSTYGYSGSDRLDVTTRNKSLSFMSPDWETMVGPYKEGSINKYQYTDLYMKKLEKNFNQIRNFFLNKEKVTLVCFCKSTSDFCHRFVLAKWLETKIEKCFYLGEI